ncbi:GOLPH3/VPS74 family protein [Nocardia callitridis]|uniref:GPP34 family phosphoprotein n=1 Tax=Nocardia callitridis TaxID=648753 RepID=A0ABP9KQA2_9NOCA
MLTVAEEFLLLALDDDTGKKLVDSTRTSAALAGAALVQLTVEGALRLTERDDPDHKPGRLVSTGKRATDPRLADLAEVAHGRKPKDAVGKVVGYGKWRSRAKNLQDALLHDLADGGYLTEDKSKALGLFPVTSWKSANRRAKSEIVQRVAAAIADTEQPDDRTSALISILEVVKLLPKLLPEVDKKTLKQRGKQISEGEWGGPAVRKAIQHIQSVNTAIIVSTTTAGASS